MPDKDTGLIFTTPLFHEKIWGGRRLADDFGYQIPAGPIGECWAISAHPAGDCVVSEGPFAGRRLSELWDGHRELFGSAKGDRFPLLVKILDAEEDLSIQVHPNDAYAAAHEGGSLGKCECWYVLHAEPGASIVVGQHAKGRAECARLIAEGAWDSLLNVVPVHAGDFFQIDPGTVHAIRGGTMVLETQQSSDVTYRVYDYDRVQADGSRRGLHLEQSLDVIDYAAEPLASGQVTAEESDGRTRLVSCSCYVVDRLRVDGQGSLETPETFWCVSVVSGSGLLGERALAKGAHFVVPAGHAPLELRGQMELIVSGVPAT